MVSSAPWTPDRPDSGAKRKVDLVAASYRAGQGDEEGNTTNTEITSHPPPYDSFNFLSFLVHCSIPLVTAFYSPLNLGILTLCFAFLSFTLRLIRFGVYLPFHFPTPNSKGATVV